MHEQPKYDHAGFRIDSRGSGLGPTAADLVAGKMADNRRAAEQGLPPVYPNVPGVTGCLALAAEVAAAPTAPAPVEALV